MWFLYMFGDIFLDIVCSYWHFSYTFYTEWKQRRSGIPRTANENCTSITTRDTTNRYVVYSVTLETFFWKGFFQQIISLLADFDKYFAKAQSAKFYIAVLIICSLLVASLSFFNIRREQLDASNLFIFPSQNSIHFVEIETKIFVNYSWCCANSYNNDQPMFPVQLLEISRF